MNEKIIKILLVEDNDDDIVIIQDVFQKAKIMNVLNAVKNGEEALSYLRRQGRYEQAEMPGLILMDINMPKMNGFQVLEEVKKEPLLQHLPVVMLTTSAREEDIVKSYKEGACSYITKPVSFDQFTKVLERFSIYWALVAQIPEGN